MRTFYTDRYLVADRCLELLYSNDLETLELSFWGFLTVNTAKVAILATVPLGRQLTLRGNPLKGHFLQSAPCLIMVPSDGNGESRRKLRWMW